MLPSALTRRVKSALGCIELARLHSHSEYHLGGTLSSARLVLTRLLAAGLLVIFTNCIFESAPQEFLGMIIDSTGLHPAPTKLEAIARILHPQTVEELRNFLGPTGYFRQFVPSYSLTAAPLNILPNRDFALKRARKNLITWEIRRNKRFSCCVQP